jgi:hypothetical protein
VSSTVQRSPVGCLVMSRSYLYNTMSQLAYTHAMFTLPLFSLTNDQCSLDDRDRPQLPVGRVGGGVIVGLQEGTNKQVRGGGDLRVQFSAASRGGEEGVVEKAGMGRSARQAACMHAEALTW